MTVFDACIARIALAVALFAFAKTESGVLAGTTVVVGVVWLADGVRYLVISVRDEIVRR